MSLTTALLAAPGRVGDRSTGGAGSLAAATWRVKVAESLKKLALAAGPGRTVLHRRTSVGLDVPEVTQIYLILSLAPWREGACW